MAPLRGDAALMLELAHLPAWAPKPISPEDLLRGFAVVLKKGAPFSLDPEPALVAPPATAGHTARRVAIPRGDGGEPIPAWWLVPKGELRSALLFMHGTSAHTLAPYFRLIQGLLASGVAVLFPELDGHGENPEPLRPERVAEPGRASLAWLRAQAEVDPAKVSALGVSVGAACVVRVAAEAEAAGAPLRSVVLFAPPSRLNFDDWARMAEALGLMNPENLDILPHATPDRMLGFLVEPIRVACGPEGAVITSDELNPRVLVGLNWAVEALQPLDAAAGLKTPMCVVGGEWDNLTPIYQMVDHYARAAGPKALHLIPRRNHFTITTSHVALKATVDWVRRWA